MPQMAPRRGRRPIMVTGDETGCGGPCSGRNAQRHVVDDGCDRAGLLDDVEGAAADEDDGDDHRRRDEALGRGDEQAVEPLGPALDPGVGP
ncbi:MAG: hypothetical protein MZV63_57820, partial [Marinilabiliales bacterium]|nr:hypothetical protein [Marinilabiliales bacterium]